MDLPEGRHIGITDTTLRDAHQSLLATRMKTEDMIPIAEKMDNLGFYSLEVWGGATFDTCMRFLNENPWDRLINLRKVFKKTKLQMLLRGQNLVGYRHYPDDVVEAFVAKSAEHGIDIFRVFDALNDIRNMDKAIKEVKKNKKHAQGTISYTIGPIYNQNYYIHLGQQLKNCGADSICIKDMAGILTPAAAYKLVKALKEKVGLPIQMHTHYTSGMGSMMYLKAIEAGADIIDTANSALALGTSQPATETMVAVLNDFGYKTGINLKESTELAEYFKEVRKKYAKFDVYKNGVDVNVLRYQVPGGMLSNFINQLSEQKALDKLEEVLAEVPRVRADLGYPPLVTPSSQIVGTQSVLNVLLKKRYKIVTNEVKNYMKGLYGRPPGKVNEEIRKKIIGDIKPISKRPADTLEPEMKKTKKELKDKVSNTEELLMYVLFPQVAKTFFEEKDNIKPKEIRDLKNNKKPQIVKTNFLGLKFAKRLKNSKNFFAYEKKNNQVEVKTCTESPNLEKQYVSGEGYVIRAPLPGKILSIYKNEGDHVVEGEKIMVLEAMKMENDISAPKDGVITKILNNVGIAVNSGDILFVIK